MSPEQAQDRVRLIERRARQYAEALFIINVAPRLDGKTRTFANVYPQAYAAGRELAEALVAAEEKAERERGER